MESCEKLIRACQTFGREHGPYIRMYHTITLHGGEEAARHAKAIEAIAARMYTRLLREEQKSGRVRQDIDPGAFAMFFDNLLMMLHFSYGCVYYKERMKYYCPDSEDRDEMICRQMMKFVAGALGIEETDAQITTEIDG